MFILCKFQRIVVDYIWGVAVVQWVGHGSFKREVPCSIPGGLQWCQEGHPTSNAPVPH